MEVKPYKILHPFRKLNKELIDVIVKDIAEGSTHKLAAESNGITARIAQIWYRQGEVDIEHNEDSLCAYLVRSLGEVKKNEIKWCRKVTRKSQKGHKGAEWTLEHAYMRDFGSNVAVNELAEELAELKAKLGVDMDGNFKSSEKEQASNE